MLKNYFKTSFRNMTRHKLHSFINIFGLSLGLACCFLIMLFVQDELSYDAYHENADNIYRVTRVWASNSPAPVAPAMVEQFPGVEKMTRFARYSNTLVAYENKSFYKTVHFADKDVFIMFSFELLSGNPENVLAEPGTVVISESMSKTLFGNENPVGKTLLIANAEKYTVTGIFKDIPRNSHFTFDFLGSFSSLNGGWVTNWHINASSISYLLLNENADPKQIEQALPEFFNKNAGKAYDFFRMQALKDIHLRSEFGTDIGVNGSIQYIYIFSSIAFFILLIACINFMNLSTASSGSKAKEVGLRKVVGAFRFQLIKQFLAESMLNSLISLILAFAIASLFLPVVNELTGKVLSLDFSHNILFFGAAFVLTMLVGVLAGSYPAFFLSAFNPVKVLKGSLSQGARSGGFRKILVASQFSITIFLLICIMVVTRQVEFIKNKPLGFNKDNVIEIPIPGEIRSKFDIIKREFVNVPNVLGVTAVNQTPGERSYSDWLYRAQGMPETRSDVLVTFSVDHDFFKTLNIDVTAGRDFSKEFQSDANGGVFIINQSAVKKLELQNPVGQEISILDIRTKKSLSTSPIVGVVKDFHFNGVYQEILPAIFRLRQSSLRKFAVKLRAENTSDTIRNLETAWSKIIPNRPFEYAFIDDNFNNLYASYEKLGTLFGYAAFIAILIACLGLFGLVSYSADQRKKELGIRKVLGASVSRIIRSFSFEFLKIVLIANVIAWPAAYFAMNQWLTGFAYQIPFHPMIFVAAAMLTIVIAMLTLAYQSVQAALANPVNALRSE